MFIQFLHPGEEHEPETQSYIDWNYLEHKRKFIKIQGEYISDYYSQSQKKTDELNLWCEWEPQSTVIKNFNGSNSKFLPKYLFNPYFDLSADLTKHIGYSFSKKTIKLLQSQGVPDIILRSLANILIDIRCYDIVNDTPKNLTKLIMEQAIKSHLDSPGSFSAYKDKILNASKKYFNRQNTDPFIFGENFNFFICRQRTVNGFTKLTELKSGDVVLFGTNKNNCDFVLDTVFVVSDKPPITYLPSNFTYIVKGNISEEYCNISFVSAFSKFLKKQTTYQSNQGFKLYFGATYDNPINGMFSFAPVKLHENIVSQGFERPVITIKNHISDGLNTNFFATAENNSALTKLLWDETVKQVLTDGQDLLLGTKFAMPENKTKLNYQIPENIIFGENNCIPELDENDNEIEK